MPLLGNGIYGMKVAGNATLLGSLPVNRKNFASNVLTWKSANREFNAYPSGTSVSAFHKPLKYGGIAATIKGGGLLTTADISAIGVLSANLEGSGTITQATLNGGVNLVATLTGGGDLVVSTISAKANMTCIIRIGANPSAFDISQAIWGAIAAQNDEPGTMGNKLNSAGGAADPWADPKALTVGKFLGLK